MMLVSRRERQEQSPCPTVRLGTYFCSCRLPKPQHHKNAAPKVYVHYDGIYIDKYVIMPNYIEMMLVSRRERQEQSPCPTVRLGTFFAIAACQNTEMLKNIA